MASKLLSPSSLYTLGSFCLSLFALSIAENSLPFNIINYNGVNTNGTLSSFTFRPSANFVIVNQDGSGDFTTITDAVAAAPDNADVNDGYYVIYIVSGVYQEYITITRNKKYVMMVGDGINQTVITGSRYNGDPEDSSTFTSGTLIVEAEGFVAKEITIRNTAGPSSGQAVAVRSSADYLVFYKCSFEAYQDTLYTHSGRQFFRECDIYGTVDFVFGNAAVVLQNCNIFGRLPNRGQANMFTAQGRADPNQMTGTSIQRCYIKATPELDSSDYTVRSYLGRPWKEYSLTVYMQSFIDRLIEDVGWDPWSGENLDTLYYAEYDNWGPGSDTSNRVDWDGYHVIDANDAVNFTVSNLLFRGQDWVLRSGVPYYVGL